VALCLRDDHPIVQVWESTILPALLDVINDMGIPMTHIDVIRLYRPSGVLSPTEQDDEAERAPVVVYVGARDEAASRKSAGAFSARCNDVLQSHGINGVFVEIHLSTVSLFSPPFLANGLVSSTRRYELGFQLCMGMDIAPITKPDGRGTGGVFLRLEGRPELFLLTCGHVLADETTTERSPHSAPRPGATVMLLGRNSYGERLDTLAREQDRHRDIALARAGFMELGQSAPSSAEVDPEKQLADQLERLLQRLNGNAWKDEENRVIGKVLCFSRGGRGIVWHPSGSPLAGTVLKPGLRLGFEDDWGLIEVNRKCLTPGFKANFIPIVNTLPVAPAFAPVPEVFDGDSLRVSGIAPFSDFYDKPTRVFKRGAATGETVGTINSIKSVRREYFTKVFMFNDNGQTTEHNGHVDTLALLVFGTSGPFSKRGDSGSAVIDERGRVLAMVWGGPVNDNEVSLLLYATPMEFIFDRMRQLYDLEPSLVSISPSLLTTAWNWFGKVWG
jgi:hypothetical protein